MISACMTVSVRELHVRTAVREWACCDYLSVFNWHDRIPLKYLPDPDLYPGINHYSICTDDLYIFREGSCVISMFRGIKEIKVLVQLL